MNKLLVILFGLAAALFVTVTSVHAQMGWGMMGNFYNNDSSASSNISQTEQQNRQKLQQMVNDLLKSQHVSSADKLDCSKIPSDQLEKLGDAWMDVMIPNENTHQAMDTMMGGDGSQRLTNAHIGMAEQYLGCTNTPGHTNSYGWMPMMAAATGGGVFPMMGWGGYGGIGMMGGNFGWGFATLGFIFWLVAFIDLILLGIFLWKRIKAKK